MLLRIILILLLCAAIVCFAVGLLLFRLFVRRSDKVPGVLKNIKPSPEAVRQENERTKSCDWLRRLPILEETDTWSADGLKLHAHFLPAAEPTQKTVLCIHGYRCSGLREWGIYADWYHRQGYNLLMPDDRAHGASEGKYIGFGWLDRLDILRWTEVLRARFGENCEIVLHGVSMGAAAVLMTGGEEALPPQVKGIVADCGYTSVWDEFVYQMHGLIRLPVFPFLHIANGISRAAARYSFREANTLEQTKKIRVPVLFVHGDADTFVPTEMGYTLYNACTAPKKLLIVRGAGHAGSWLTDRGAYETALSDFFRQTGMAPEK